MDDKIRVRLIGENGNAFNLIGLVDNALRKAGQLEKAKEFLGKAMQAGSYNDLLCLCMEYVDIC